tara:strand:- start:9396 stop:10514 length:1119 start_codon:yes stop_codon:yes gene_type:complete
MFDPISLQKKVIQQKRKIIHVDMDSFFASVEMRDNPAWRNIPLAVGGDPGRRGVLSTCNYLARKFGVRSAMPSSHALRLCPELLIVPGRMSAYKEASNIVRNILSQFTDQIEPVSLDEAYIDVSECTDFGGSATLLAAHIRKEIAKQTNLSASAGIAPNKFLAKMAGEWNKPNGQFTITPAQVHSFMSPLALIKLPGIGAKTAESLDRQGLKYCHQIQESDLFTLRRRFGNWAHRLYELSFGFDDNPVISHWQRKSLGVEETFEKDLSPQDCTSSFEDLYIEMSARLKRYQQREPSAKAYKSFVKIKTHDFKQHTFERILEEKTMNAPSYEDYIAMLRELIGRNQTSIRLIGLGVRLNYDDEPAQLSMAIEA